MLNLLLSASLVAGIFLGYRFNMFVLLPAIPSAICVTLIAEAFAHAPLHDTMSAQLAWSVAGHLAGVLVVLEIGYMLGMSLKGILLTISPPVGK